MMLLQSCVSTLKTIDSTCLTSKLITLTNQQHECMAKNAKIWGSLARQILKHNKSYETICKK